MQAYTLLCYIKFLGFRVCMHLIHKTNVANQTEPVINAWSSNSIHLTHTFVSMTCIYACGSSNHDSPMVSKLCP